MDQQQNETQPPPLTIDDPVDERTRHRLGVLNSDRTHLCLQLGELKVDEVRIVRRLTEIDSETQRIFSTLMQDRGLIPGKHEIGVDGQTGKVSLIGGDGSKP